MQGGAMKHNRKIQLRYGSKYLGSRDNVTEEVHKIIEKILSGDVMIPPPNPPVEPNIIYIRATQETMNQLGVIAEKHGISINELLRLGLEQNNLVSIPNK